MQYKTAKAWGRTPSEWALLSKKDKTIMMAFDRAEGVIEGWHMEEIEKNRPKHKNKPDRRQPRQHIDKRKR